MLAPEVINLWPPKSFNSEHLNAEKTEKMIKQLYFNHSVTMLLPDTLNPPNSLLDVLTNDTSYYIVKNLPAYELVNQQFTDMFIKNGSLTLLSVDKRVDLDDCVSINADGLLTLLVDSNSFYSLGLEGSRSEYKKNRFLIRYDLKSKDFSKQCLRVSERLSALPELKFDAIIYWQSSDSAVCPSSIAAWFSQAGYVVSTCPGKFERKTYYNVQVPCYIKNSLEELIEWAGMLLLDCDTDPKNSALSSYQTPEGKTVGQIVALQWSGLLPPSLIINSYHKLKEWTTNRASSEWTCMIIHGFQDSLTSIGSKEHYFSVEGDFNLNIFMSSDESVSSLMHVSSWNTPRK